MLNIVLYEPEMPPNTANIGRTCLATNTKLHIINPKFEIDRNKRLGRPSKNNWEHVDKEIYENWNDFILKNNPKNIFILTKFGTKKIWDVDLNVKTKTIFLVLGSESYGLPDDITSNFPEMLIKLPMHAHSKTNALNLSNVAAICMYESVKQTNDDKMI